MNWYNTYLEVEAKKKKKYDDGSPFAIANWLEKKKKIKGKTPQAKGRKKEEIIRAIKREHCKD